MTATIQTISPPVRGAGGRRRGGAAAQYRAVDPPGRRRHLARPDPRLAAHCARAGTGAARHSAAADLFGRRRHELARIQFQSAPDRLLAFGCILFTAGRWRRVSYYLLGMPWAVGFVLGAIVSPTDAVAPLAIVRRLGLPRRLIVVLEGEGLANDATALDSLPLRRRRGRYRFVFGRHGRERIRAHRRRRDRLWGRHRLGELAAAPLGGRSARRDHAVADDALCGVSGAGVPRRLGRLATVAAGLYVSWNGPLLIPAATRLQGIFFWDLLIYLLEGLSSSSPACSCAS